MTPLSKVNFYRPKEGKGKPGKSLADSPGQFRQEFEKTPLATAERAGVYLF